MNAHAKLNPHIFRAYDIRGLVGEDLNELTVELLGKGIGTYLAREGAEQIAVGMDNRPSSEHLKEALINGVLSTGLNVVDIGLSTSPLLYSCVIMWNLGGGINVTGSHNPVEFNGFKIVSEDAFPVAAEDIQRIRQLIESEDFEEAKGSRTERDPKDEYFEKIRGAINLERPMKVAVDTGNGVPGLFIPPLLKSLGCEVTELYTELDGSFPHHLPDPETEANLRDLSASVTSTGAEVGFGYDGDGDRVGIVDELGRYREADYIIILLARDYLTRNPGARILVDVKSSKNVLHDIRMHGGEPLLWKTGHSLVKRKMREENISLGGELSGHMFVFEDFFPIDDALFATCRILEFLSKSEKSISEHLEGLPELFSTRLIEIPTADEAKFDVIENVTERFAKKYEVNDVDGARIDFDGGWAIVRASNTTPNLTVRFEAESQEKLEQIRAEVYDVLKDYPSVDLESRTMH